MPKQNLHLCGVPVGCTPLGCGWDLVRVGRVAVLCRWGFPVPCWVPLPLVRRGVLDARIAAGVYDPGCVLN